MARNDRALTARNKADLAPKASDPKKPRPKQADWAICDVSGSMSMAITTTDGNVVKQPDGSWLRRIDCLNAALKGLGDDVQVIAFSDQVSLEKVGEFTPNGSTYYCLGLREAIGHEPSYIVIISDGEITDNREEALGLVDKLAQTAIIDCIYIGPPDSRAESFMREIATKGHGRFKKYDAVQLESKMTTLLPPPQEEILQ